TTTTVEEEVFEPCPPCSAEEEEAPELEYEEQVQAEHLGGDPDADDQDDDDQDDDDDDDQDDDDQDDDNDDDDDDKPDFKFDKPRVRLPIIGSPRHEPNPKNFDKSPWYGEGRIVGNSFVAENYIMSVVPPPKRDEEDDDGEPDTQSDSPEQD
ncbi:MAG: hypothetical protein JSV49_05425, partial [Thermoplasmata archaeon]